MFINNVVYEAKLLDKTSIYNEIFMQTERLGFLDSKIYMHA